MIVCSVTGLDFQKVAEPSIDSLQLFAKMKSGNFFAHTQRNTHEEHKAGCGCYSNEGSL